MFYELVRKKIEQHVQKHAGVRLLGMLKLQFLFELNAGSKVAVVDVIIPAFNESKSIGNVLADIPESHVREIIVIDNNSSDFTTEVSRKSGATVLRESRQGYGYACLCGINYLAKKKQKPDIVLFLDADYSDYPEETPQLLKPILESGYDLVIGSRSKGNKEKGAMTVQQIIGNKIAVTLMQFLYNVEFSDLGPFRAIRYDKLLQLNMQDTTYGWTVEMQVKAAKSGLRCCEVPVRYRKRIGHSKISGTVKGTVLAGYKIITTIFKYA